MVIPIIVELEISGVRLKLLLALLQGSLFTAWVISMISCFPFETSSCHKANRHRMSNFSHLVKLCGLIDMGYHGPAYTWCNKRYSSVPTYERLDRCLANVEWCNVYPNTSVFNLPIIISDHAPILTISQPTTVKIKKSFKFENWWLMEKDFQETASNAWISSAHYPFHACATNLAGSLKRWCKTKRPL